MSVSDYHHLGLTLTAYDEPYSDIWDELKEENPNIPKILEIFKRVFEDLIISANPIAYSEVDSLCTTIFLEDELFNKLPEWLQEIIKKGMTLRNWTKNPRFCIATPDEMLEEIIGILSEYEDV